MQASNGQTSTPKSDLVDPHKHSIPNVTVVAYYGDCCIRQRLSGGEPIFEANFSTHNGQVLLLRSFVFGALLMEVFTKAWERRVPQWSKVIYIHFPVLERAGAPTFLHLVNPKEQDVAKGVEYVIQNVYNAKVVIPAAMPRPVDQAKAYQLMATTGCPHPSKWVRPDATAAFNVDDFLDELSSDTNNQTVESLLHLYRAPVRLDHDNDADSRCDDERYHTPPKQSPDLAKYAMNSLLSSASNSDGDSVAVNTKAISTKRRLFADQENDKLANIFGELSPSDHASGNSKITPSESGITAVATATRSILKKKAPKSDASKRRRRETKNNVQSNVMDSCDDNDVIVL